MKGNEAEYIIPLRKETMKVPKYDRTKKSVIAVRQFLQKHTKSKDVLLGKELNRKLQENGRKNVFPKVHVKVVKDTNNYKAELIGHKIELDKDKEAKDKKAPKVKETKQEEVKTENKEVKETPKTDAKSPAKTQETKQEEVKAKTKEVKKAPEEKAN